MAGENSKFSIDFVADIKELRKVISELKGFQKQFSSQAKQQQKQEKGHWKERHKSLEKEKDFYVNLRKQDNKNNLDLFSSLTKRQKAEKSHMGMLSSAAARERKKGQKAQEDEEKKLKGMARRIGLTSGITSGLISGGIGLIGGIIGGAVNFARGSIESAFEQYQKVSLTRMKSIGMAPPDIIREITGAKGTSGAAVKEAGNMGFNIQDVTEMAPAAGRATGVMSPVEMMRSMRSFGLEAGEAAEALKTLKQSGMSFQAPGAGPGDVMGVTGGKKDSAGGRELAKIMAAGVESGIERTRLAEYMSGVQGLMEQEMGRAAGNVRGGAIAQLAAALGKGGGAGFKGSRGAALLSQIGNAFVNPGGGEAGMTFMRQAMGFGRPGGNSTFIEAERMREQGLRGGIGGFRNVMGQFQQQFGGGGEGQLAMREILGVSLDQAKKLQDIYKAGNFSAESQKQIEDIMEKAKPLEEQTADNTKGMLTEAQEIAKEMKKASDHGEEFAAGIHELEHFLQDIRDFLLGEVRTFIENIPGGGGLKEKRLAKEEAILTQTPTSDMSKRDFEEFQRRRGALIDERSDDARKVVRENTNPFTGKAGLYESQTDLDKAQAEIAKYKEIENKDIAARQQLFPSPTNATGTQLLNQLGAQGVINNIYVVQDGVAKQAGAPVRGQLPKKR